MKNNSLPVRHNNLLKVKFSNTLLAGLFGLALVLANIPAAWSQVLEEIVVTATKRTESLQDIGISVTAFSGDELELQHLSGAQEILLKVPNFDIVNNGAYSFGNFFIRGVGSKGLASSNSVGVYVDEVVLESPAVNLAQVYDMERVEVMAGPQNTLYGRNTTGGAVNYVTRKPEIGGEANGFLSAGYGRWDSVELDGAFGAPLGDKAAVRIAAQYHTRDDFRDNSVYGTEIGGVDKYGIRGQLAFQLTDDLYVRLKGHYEEIKSDLDIIMFVGTQDPNDPSMPCATPNKPGACADNAGYVGSGDQLDTPYSMARPRTDVEAHGFSAHIRWEFDNFTFTSITGYEENEASYTEDSDATPGYGFHFWKPTEQEQVSQEFRLSSADEGKLRWHLGVYGFWEETAESPGPVFGDGIPGNSFLVKAHGVRENTTYSGYIDVEYDLAEPLTFKGGFRYGSDNVEGNARAIFGPEARLGMDLTTPLNTGNDLPDFEELWSAAVANGLNTVTVGGPDNPDARINDTTWEEWGAKVGFDYRMNDNILAFAQWSRGYKAGNFNTAPMTIMIGLADTPLPPEKVDAFEIGLKSELAGGKARFNIAGFFNDFRGQQLSQFIGGSFTRVSVDSEIWGMDATLDWLPMENTFINVSVGYLDAEIVKGSVGAADPGNVLPGSPDLNMRFSVRQDWPVGNGMFGVMVDGRYMDERWFDVANTFPDEEYFVLNVNGYYTFGADDRYRISVYGKNVTDTLYASNGFEGLSPGGNVYYMGQPATWGVSARMDF